MRKEYLLLTLTAFLWASVHPVGKILLNDFTPLQFALIRSGFAFLTSLLVLLLNKNWVTIRRMDKRSIVLCMIFGLFGFFLFQVSMSSALSKIPASINGIIINTITPIFIFIVSFFLLQKRVTKYNVLGIILGSIGVILIVLRPEDLSLINITGVTFAILSAVFWGIHCLGISNIRKKYGTILVSTISTLFGFIFTFLAVAFLDGFKEFFAATLNTTLLFLYAGIFATGVPVMLFYYSLKRLSVIKANVFYQFLLPIFVVILSAILLQELITSLLIVGTFFILVGIGLVQREKF